MISLTKQAVAEAVPDARRSAPSPTASDARNKREVYPDDGNQQITQTYVDHQQIGGRPQPLEFAVEDDDNNVVAKAEHPDGPDGEGEKFVGADGEDGMVRTSLLSGAVVRIHCADTNLVRVRSGGCAPCAPDAAAVSAPLLPAPPMRSDPRLRLHKLCQCARSCANSGQ